MRNTRMGAAFALLALASNASAGELPDCFLGRWRSNESLTLADMRNHHEVTPKARALFEAGFFGRLVLVNTRTRSGGYFDSEQDRKSLSLEPIQVLSSTPTSAVVRTDLVDIAHEPATTSRSRTTGLVMLIRGVGADAGLSQLRGACRHAGEPGDLLSDPHARRRLGQSGWRSISTARRLSPASAPTRAGYGRARNAWRGWPRRSEPRPASAPSSSSLPAAQRKG